jgi:hypothetical protein
MTITVRSTSLNTSNPKNLVKVKELISLLERMDPEHEVLVDLISSHAGVTGVIEARRNWPKPYDLDIVLLTTDDI